MVRWMFRVYPAIPVLPLSLVLRLSRILTVTRIFPISSISALSWSCFYQDPQVQAEPALAIEPPPRTGSSPHAIEIPPRRY